MFDSAADVEAYQPGSETGVPLLAATRTRPCVAVEAKLAALDGAEAALRLRLGHGGDLDGAVRRCSKPGDEVVCSAAIYGGTFHLIDDAPGALRRDAHGSRRSRSSRTPARLIGPTTKMVWFESPINPTLRCVDMRAVATACRARRRALGDRQHVRQPDQPAGRWRWAWTSSMQSATKYLNGHSDVTGGVLVGPAALIGRLRQGAAAARRHPRSAAGLRPRPRHEDAARCAWRGTTRRRWRVARVRCAGTRASRAVLLPGAAVASRSRHRARRR